MDILSIAMETATKLGVDYADIRLQRTLSQRIFLRNLSLKQTNNSESYGYGIRVLKNGGWGFAHSSILTKEVIVKTVKKAFELAELSSTIKADGGITLAPEKAYIDTYKTPLAIDPFTVSEKEKIELMLEVNRTMLNFAPVKLAYFSMHNQKDHKLFASTLGTRLDMTTVFVHPMLGCTAVDETDSQSRTFDNGGIATGWEYIGQLHLLEKAPVLAEEAVMKLKAETLATEKRRDLILDPKHLSLTMHESVGHPTELDRVLGWEADYAGISFATPEKLKNYRYGSSLVNFIADNRLEKGLATAGYDDDGVPGQRWHIIKDGILNEYGTTRETALKIGETSSRGCNRATDYSDQPINRIPNLYLEPGKKQLTPQELIASTQDGVYIEGQGSFSIDQHRVNFQFGGDLFWEIKNGKKNRMLKKVLYRSHNPEFWNSCDAICDERFFATFGVTNCGKGQPNQTGRMTHGASPARFKKIITWGSK